MTEYERILERIKEITTEEKIKATQKEFERLKIGLNRAKEIMQKDMSYFTKDFEIVLEGNRNNIVAKPGINGKPVFALQCRYGKQSSFNHSNNDEQTWYDWWRLEHGMEID